MIDEDVAVVRAVQAGNTEAYRLLVERHQGRLYGTIFRLVGDPHAAEEVAQDAFVRAFHAIGGFREESRFGTWLIQIGIHAARDHLRQRMRLRRRRVVSLEELQSSEGPDFEPRETNPAADPWLNLVDRETRDLVKTALAGLPEEYREVLVLKHFEGRPYEEIAHATGDSVGTLKVRAHRARRLLKWRLAELGWDGARDEASRPARARDPGKESKS